MKLYVYWLKIWLIESFYLSEW